jgi:hypothetical protein
MCAYMRGMYYGLYNDLKRMTEYKGAQRHEEGRVGRMCRWCLFVVKLNFLHTKTILADKCIT